MFSQSVVASTTPVGDNLNKSQHPINMKRLLLSILLVIALIVCLNVLGMDGSLSSVAGTTSVATNSLAIVSGVIDGTAIGNTTIYTVPTGKQFIVSKVIIVPTTVTSLVTPSTVSLGKTSSTFVDVIAATALTGLITVNTSAILTPVLGSTVFQAGDAVVLRVSVGASGTAYSFKAIIIGVQI